MNYYQILGLNGQATHSEIKQAYRRLALQYHPDKNPDTKEIFQRINEAYSTLSNENKKYEYDNRKTQQSQPTPPTPQTSSHGRNFHRHFTPDDEFEIFAQSLRKQFNQRKYKQSQPKKPTPKPQNQSEHIFRLLSKLILLIVLVILASSNFSYSKVPLYQFHKSPEYSNQRTSKQIQVKYFVGDKFKKEIITDEKLIKFDFEVEKTYVNRLKKQCINVNRKYETYQIMMQRAHHSYEKTNLKRIIDSQDWNSCDQITEFKYIFDTFDKVF